MCGHHGLLLQQQQRFRGCRLGDVIIHGHGVQRGGHIQCVHRGLRVLCVLCILCILRGLCINHHIRRLQCVRAVHIFQHHRSQQCHAGWFLLRDGRQQFRRGGVIFQCGNQRRLELSSGFGGAGVVPGRRGGAAGQRDSAQ